MDREARIKELKRLFTTPENQLRPNEFKTFNDLHKRIDALVGRPTMTHEFAFPELLYKEIKSGKHGNPLGESLEKAAKLTKSKKALIVTQNKEEGINLGFKVVGKVDFSQGKKK